MRYGLLDDNPSSVIRRFKRYSRLKDTSDHGMQRFLRVSSYAKQNRAATRMLSTVPKNQTRAAVLVGLHVSGGQMCVILTVRAGGISHSGEVSLPGGKLDPDDNNDEVHCALREAQEEIGLGPAGVRVLSVLSPIVSRHLVLVTPVVGLVSAEALSNLKPSPGEVAQVFHCPLRMFVKAQGFAHLVDWNGLEFRVPGFEYALKETFKSVKIWGLTAKILVRVSEIALHLRARRSTLLWSSDEPGEALTKTLMDRFRNLGKRKSVQEFAPVLPPPLPPGCCFWLFQTQFVQQLEWLVSQMHIAKERRKGAELKARL
eukprot:TRINITY_DN51122_c0_g1_i1.p1 TRINITY_DN51122_c0_g1~~TRINITY_DN51122_c0_g1_i1.p1  ORF type:complete len:315 (+),score=58.92 TRINITY_DN51122_c0_g1_i1:207-1151(+)